MKKFCKDCKWLDTNTNHHCTHNKCKDESPVDGQVEYPFADLMRKPFGECKPRGRYWEPKEDDVLNQVKHIRNQKTMTLVISHRLLTFITAGLSAFALILAIVMWPK